MIQFAIFHGAGTHRSGLTLIEVLVIVVILSVLIMLMAPFDVGSREAARRMQCSSQVHQINLAIHNYA
jgi:competence protein ComGC